VGAALDPCGVLQTSFELEPDERVEIRIFLGQTTSVMAARSLITRYRAADLDETLPAVVRCRDDVLDASSTSPMVAASVSLVVAARGRPTRGRRGRRQGPRRERDFPGPPPRC